MKRSVSELRQQDNLSVARPRDLLRKATTAMTWRIKYSQLLIGLSTVLLAMGVACSSTTEGDEPTPLPTATALSPAVAPTLPPTAAPPPTSTSLPVPTSTTAPSPTAVPTATSTAIPAPTPTATPSPTPTPIPVPTVDPRYGLIVTSDPSRAFEVFGATTYIDYSTNVTNIPDGTQKVLYLNSVNPVPIQIIQSTAAKAPGSVWYVLGEPNSHGTLVEDVLVGLHDTYAAIKDADPTALITSPSILNYSFNCINCGGYAYGATWITDFFFDYRDLFGEEPPIDIWAIDVFPIVWPGGNLSGPDAFPTVRDDIVVSQVREFREWVDSRESTRGDPIWITEFGLHWGFPDWEFGVEGCGSQPSPIGDYLTDEVQDYLERAYTWFETNSEPLNIAKWFTFSSYRDITRCQGDSGNGLSFLDSSGTSGNLTDIGTFYNNWIRGIR